MLRFILLGLPALLGLVLLGLVAVFYKPDLARDQLADYQNPASRFITLPSGASLHMRDEGLRDADARRGGARDAPVLVMLHGGFGSLQNWEGWIAPLGGDLRLISLDLLGHGLTGRSPDDIYTRTAQRDAVHGLMQALGIDRYTLAGNSFGGGVALEIALAFPQEVAGLVLVDSEGVPNGEDGYDTARLTDEAPLAPDDPGYARLAWYERLAARFIGPATVRGVLDDMVYDKALLSDAFVDRFSTALRHTGNRDAQILMFRQGLYLVEQNGPQDLRPRLGELQMPVLVLHGTEDRLVPMRVAEVFADEIADATLVRVEAAGHMPMIEKPDETAATVLAWFRATGLLR